MTLVLNTSASGTTGLYALTGKCPAGNVLLYATDATIGDLDPTHLFGITDTLSFTTASRGRSESSPCSPTAPSDSNFKGVSFTPTLSTPIPPATPATLIVTRTLSRSNGNVVAQITISNTGGTDAANVVITSVKIGADTATPLPVNVGTIAAGATAVATVSVPATVGNPGAASSFSLSGTYTGASFGSSARITLP